MSEVPLYAGPTSAHGSTLQIEGLHVRTFQDLDFRSLTQRPLATYGGARNLRAMLATYGGAGNLRGVLAARGAQGDQLRGQGGVLPRNLPGSEG